MRVFPEIRPQYHKRGDLHFAQWVLYREAEAGSGIRISGRAEAASESLEDWRVRGEKSDARLAHWTTSGTGQAPELKMSSLRSS